MKESQLVRISFGASNSNFNLFFVRLYCNSDIIEICTLLYLIDLKVMSVSEEMTSSGEESPPGKPNWRFIERFEELYVHYLTIDAE